jgi:hypothetical protein
MPYCKSNVDNNMKSHLCISTSVPAPQCSKENIHQFKVQQVTDIPTNCKRVYHPGCNFKADKAVIAS